MNYRNELGEITTTPEYNGTEFYLTINLKTREPIHDTLLDDVILKIRMPYTLAHTVPIYDGQGHHVRDSVWYSNGSFIKFDSLASAAVDSIENVDTLFEQDRGRYKKLYETNQQNKPTEFAITGGMLKFSDDNPADSSLTLSAYFICDGDRILTHNTNPFLKMKWWVFNGTA